MENTGKLVAFSKQKYEREEMKARKQEGGKQLKEDSRLTYGNLLSITGHTLITAIHYLSSRRQLPWSHCSHSAQHCATGVPQALASPGEAWDSSVTRLYPPALRERLTGSRCYQGNSSCTPALCPVMRAMAAGAHCEQSGLAVAWCALVCRWCGRVQGSAPTFRQSVRSSSYHGVH